ncbi:T9SS type A sorting domain-containing protein [uncultured Algibacter sp.]|uniref:T9SS type A sorting domain-containing protein n=1 Tax=uncultured Algibacter sp. TaxID=298659 RepID=UPI002607C813|nr:T9SS type A sorting domain-containing protein [uncultured Algibacter sp.]
MRQVSILLILVIFILTSAQCKAQTVWTGPTTTFTKVNYADWTQEANQDRLTENVWITRQNYAGLFNIFLESDAGITYIPSNPAPSGTEWAYGTTANYASLTYQNLNALIGQNFSNLVDGQDMVLHLITEDIYIDLKFISWTTGSGNGGGFSYERTTNQSLNTKAFEQIKGIKIFPNPASQFIHVFGLTKTENYRIYNVLGLELKSGTISNNEQIDINNLTKGVYFLKLVNGITIKFLKQ